MADLLLKPEEQAVFRLRSLYQSYGYTPYKMSRFEEYDLYVRNKDFLLSDRIITFSDDRGRLLALKPDVTLSIVKNAPQEPGEVQKVYYNENVYRDHREILQIGLECVGDLGDYEIGEVVLLAARSLQKLGKPFVLNLSHMGLVAGILARWGFEEEKQKQAIALLRRKSLHELQALCRGREAAWPALQTLVSCRGGEEVLSRLDAITHTPAEKAALAELRQIWALLKEAGFAENAFLDFSVGSDLGYYSGVVFRGYLEGIPAGVLSGGQYDLLPQKMGRKARAIGFAIYADLLEAEAPIPDIDTLILHDGTADPLALAAAARKAARSGTVLVARQYPKNRSWKNLIQWNQEDGLC